MYCDVTSIFFHFHYHPGIVTYASKPIWNYSAYSFGINLAYAEKNGYVFKYIYDGDYERTDERWSKIKILEEALDDTTGWARNFDFVMWVDADLIFLDFSFRIESIASDNPEGIATFLLSYMVVTLFVTILYCSLLTAHCIHDAKSIVFSIYSACFIFDPMY